MVIAAQPLTASSKTGKSNRLNFTVAPNSVIPAQAGIQDTN
jgi:hypothetical protein